MSRTRFFALLTTLFLLAMTASSGAAPPPPADTLSAIPGSFSAKVFDEEFSENPSAVPLATQPLHLTFALKSSHLAGLPALIKAQQDKNSPQFRHWLTPAQFAARFGADDADVQAVVDYATAQGFTPHVVSNHLFVEADATVGQVESAFHVTLHGYNRPAERVALGESPTFYAPDQAPRLPLSVTTRLTGVFGLTDFVQLHSRAATSFKKPVERPLVPNAKPAAAVKLNTPAKSSVPVFAVVPIKNVVTPMAGKSGGAPIARPKTSGISANPSFSGPLSPAQLSQVYEIDTIHNAGYLGDGTNIGIYSPTGYQASDVSTFVSAYGLSGYTLNQVNIDGGPTGNGGQLEACLDIETIIGQATHANIYIYQGPNNGSLDYWNQIASDDLPTISDSWSFSENYLHTNGFDSYESSWSTILNQMESQGQAHFVATGDNGAFSGGVSNVDMPSSHPGSTAVGGTDQLSDNSGDWASEIGWSGSGGGLSIYFSEPSWQYGPGVSNTYSNGMRQVPDVSALASPTPGYSIFQNGGWYDVYGTSASTPLWASVEDLLNQAVGGRFGNLNSYYYYLGNHYNNFNNAEVYHDMVSGNNGYPTTSQWDFVTGWGSPRFGKLYADIFELPTIYQYTPGGWNTPILISPNSSLGSEPASFDNLTTYYISGDFANSGPADAPDSNLNINLDGTDHIVHIVSDPVGYYVYYGNLFATTLSLGPHTFTLTADNGGTFSENSGSVNTYTRTITVHPYNDPFSQAIALGGASGNTTGTNAYATKESGEPNHGGRTGGASVWYSWTAPSTGYYNFNTYGSNFDTLIGVYTGSSVSALTTVAEDDDAGGTVQSSVNFFATAGTTYAIAVDGYDAATGNIALAWGQAAPSNDNFVNARNLGSGASGTIYDSNVLATKESGEPNHGGRTGGASVWYSWTAPSTGDYNFNTVGSSFDTLIGVYTGSSVSALTTVAEDDDSDGTYQSSASFHAVSGTVYYIAVDGYSADTGSITLNWQKVVLSSLGLSPSSLSVGQSTTGTVTLNLDASQTGGSVITLSASNPQVTIPATVTATSGKIVSFPVKALSGTVGTVTLTATYNGTTKTATLTVSKATPTVTVANITGAIGQTVTLSATLTRPADGLDISGRTLAFTVNGTSVGNATTNSSGVATIPYHIISTLAPGTHSISVSFAGDTSYNAASGTGTLTDTKGGTHLAVASVTGAIGQTVTLSATLSRSVDGVLVIGRTVMFSVNGTAVGNATTNSSGVATIPYHIISTLAPGAHSISVSFAGDSTYLSTTGTGTLTDTKGSTHLAVANVSGTHGTTVTLSATLSRSVDGVLVIGRTVTFSVNGTSVGTAVTNSSGVATKSYTIPSSPTSGTIPISVSFAGDSTYLSTTGTGTLTIH